MTEKLVDCGGGVFRAPGATIVDRTGRKTLPIGRDGFAQVADSFVFVDKTMFIADVLDASYAATLFCRPRRFGKTLNLTMLKAFLEKPLDGSDTSRLFEGTDVWEASGGAYRQHQGAYPVVYLSLRTVKGPTWESSYAALANVIAAEFRRHAELLTSESLSPDERAYVETMARGDGSEGDYADSLIGLTRLLSKHYGSYVIVLIDEYDAPVMAGYSATENYYDRIVAFLKQWLTGALKDGGEALQLACLTGVQRISKESIFSDLNNLVVSTALTQEFDERFGFTNVEVSALLSYMGCSDQRDVVRYWYDGYRFGRDDVYNPWSTLNYVRNGCSADIYWGNTSSNGVVGDLLRHANQDTLSHIYELLEPGGYVAAPLDLGVVFPDLGVREGALWSMLYLAGYLTTDDTMQPNNRRVLRRLRIPNHEVSELYREEVVARFATVAGGQDRLSALHRSVVGGDEEGFQRAFSRILSDSASFFDLTNENGLHMLLLGLLFGMPGYGDPASNREYGDGRPDIRVAPEDMGFSAAKMPLVTIELKYVQDPSKEKLAEAAARALAQIEERAYDEGPLPAHATGRVRWGIAAGGKRVAVAAERLL